MKNIYITSDPHRDFYHIKQFCELQQTTLDDILIILGDDGINYYGDKRDKKLKLYIKNLPITLFCIHGNHQNRPTNIPSYNPVEFHGGTVYMQDDYPNILFAKDGEIFDFNGKSAIVIGGAYSVDKFYRLSRGWKWFEDEQPSDDIKQYVESQLDSVNWKISRVLTHTTPYKYIPIEWFLPGVDQSTVDNGTELWLDGIEKKLDYDEWKCGHFHGIKTVDKVEFFHHNIKEFK